MFEITTEPRDPLSVPLPTTPISSHSFREEDTESSASTTTPTSTRGRLPLPFILPQVRTNYDSPFNRGYNNALEQAGITQEVWLQFVDDLNLAMAGFPPLLLLTLAGEIIGSLPVDELRAAAIVLPIIAEVAQHVVAATLVARMMIVANKKIFTPRGLRVRICSADDAKAIVMGDAANAEPRRNKMSVLLEQISLRFAIGKKTAKTPVDVALSPLQRRIAALGISPYILHPDVEIPAVVRPKLSQVRRKASDMSNRYHIKEARTRQKRADWNRHLLAIAEGKTDRLPPTVGKKWSEKKRAKVEGKALKRRENEKKLGKLQESVRRLDRFHELKGQRVLWLVLTNADQEEGVTAPPVSLSSVSHQNDVEWQDTPVVDGTDEGLRRHVTRNGSET